MIIRTFEYEDFETVVMLWERCNLVSDSGDLELDIERKVAHDKDLFLVAEITGEVIGTLMGGYDGYRGSGYFLAVHPDFRGRGIANALINRLEKRLLAKGCAKLNFIVDSDNIMMINMYEKIEYIEQSDLIFSKQLINHN